MQLKQSITLRYVNIKKIDTTLKQGGFRYLISQNVIVFYIP